MISLQSKGLGSPKEILKFRINECPVFKNRNGFTSYSFYLSKSYKAILNSSEILANKAKYITLENFNPRFFLQSINQLHFVNSHISSSIKTSVCGHISKHASCAVHFLVAGDTEE